MFENGWWEDAYFSSYPYGFAAGHKLQKPSKESSIFQTLDTISLVKILKETSLDLSSFLSFNFDGRPIKFQMRSCRGNIVEINA